MSGLESAWDSVRREAARLKPLHLRDLFASDPRRFDRLSLRFDDLLVDFQPYRALPRPPRGTFRVEAARAPGAPDRE